MLCWTFSQHHPMHHQNGHPEFNNYHRFTIKWRNNLDYIKSILCNHRGWWKFRPRHMDKYIFRICSTFVPSSARPNSNSVVSCGTIPMTNPDGNYKTSNGPVQESSGLFTCPIMKICINWLFAKESLSRSIVIARQETIFTPWAVRQLNLGIWRVPEFSIISPTTGLFWT